MFGKWNLTYTGTRYDFGTPDLPVEVVEWDQSSDVYHVDDTPNPRSDGIATGQDFVEPGDITISVKIDFRSAPYDSDECVRRAMEARSRLAQVWRADSIRAVPGALAELTIGGEYIVEGRPRQVSFDDTHQNVGLIFAELTFIPAFPTAALAGANGGWHDAVIGLVAAQSGGLSSPLVSPLRSSVESTRAAPLTIGGDAPAWGIYKISGPMQSGAQLEIPNRWRLTLNRALAWNEVVTIDTRPGRRATYLGSRPVQVLDPRSSLLADCSLLPGKTVLALRGASIEGTASVSVRWRDTKGAI